MQENVRLIDANALKEFINNGRVCDICPDKKLNCAIHCDFPDTLTPLWEKVIDNAPTVEEVEKPFITECRNTAIKENLPLYFVYYEETGVFEVYVTKTKELFEKRHCIKHLSEYRFRELAMQYLDDYSDWGGSTK